MMLVLMGLMLAIVITPTIADEESSQQSVLGCFNDWSRCSQWSSALTGVFWKSCNDRCVKDKNKARGECVRVPNTCRFRSRESTVLQCQCFDFQISSICSRTCSILCSTCRQHARYQYMKRFKIHSSFASIEDLFFQFFLNKIHFFSKIEMITSEVTIGGKTQLQFSGIHSILVY